MHTPTLQRALRCWRRHVASQRELRGQRDAWRVAITVLGTARALDRQQGALCRLAAWCRGRRARASTLIGASKRLASVRARHATHRWQAAARARALGASARLRLCDHAALGRARAGLRALEAAARRARRRAGEAASARALAARAAGARLLRRLRAHAVRGHRRHRLTLTLTLALTTLTLTLTLALTLTLTLTLTPTPTPTPDRLP